MLPGAVYSLDTLSTLSTKTFSVLILPSIAVKPDLLLLIIPYAHPPYISKTLYQKKAAKQKRPPLRIDHFMN